MPKGDFLGEFEILVLAAVHQLGDDAYGVTIKHEIERRVQRAASIGAIHAALGRLADKGFVAFRVSDPLPVRGGRARKFAGITRPGIRALRHSVRAFARMVEGLDLGTRQG
jgi:PadR family transcriptional regulator, regulatory protein PadR